MKPKDVARALWESARTQDPPQRVSELAAKLLLEEGGVSRLEAWEEAERIEPRVIKWLARRTDEAIARREPPKLVENSSSSVHFQGYLFSEPCDPPEVRDLKVRRAQSAALRAWLASLHYEDFERLSAKILSLLGARDYTQTRRSKDQGIDFYGKLVLADLDAAQLPFLRFQHDFQIWIMGQAKHYPAGVVSAPEIRELVVAVLLAHAKAFGTKELLYQDLTGRLADPLVVLFLTTGSYTRDARVLGEAAGVILKTGQDIADFLADKEIGFDSVDQSFRVELAARWLQS